MSGGISTSSTNGDSTPTVGDIVAEIERNLGSLKRQAAKAERFIAYRGELEDLQLQLPGLEAEEAAPEDDGKVETGDTDRGNVTPAAHDPDEESAI